MTECPTRVRIAAALGIALLLAACETPPPDLAHPKSYAKDGISFEHPGNWSVREEVEQDDTTTYRYVFVEAPDGALALAVILVPPIEGSVEEFAVGYRRGLIEALDERLLIEASASSSPSEVGVPVRSVVAGSTRDGVEHAFAASALGQVVPHRFRVFDVASRAATIFLVVQAASEDWVSAAPGFDLVLASFQLEARR